jgi:hypothetical protein
MHTAVYQTNCKCKRPNSTKHDQKELPLITVQKYLKNTGASQFVYPWLERGSLGDQKKLKTTWLFFKIA